MKFSFALANKDTKESHRKNAGDFIAYKPSGHKWSALEKKRFLITEIEVKDKDAAHRLCTPLYDNDKYPDEMSLEEIRSSKTVAKRRHYIDLTKLGIDIERIEDDADEYQPVSLCDKSFVDEKTSALIALSGKQ